MEVLVFIVVQLVNAQLVIIVHFRIPQMIRGHVLLKKDWVNNVGLA